jgi:catechol-2,3-dioxygenase
MEIGAITLIVKDMGKMARFYRDIMKIPMGCVKLLWLTQKGT